MPANFPTAEQKRYYGRFVEKLTPEQLGGYFHLTDTDCHLVYSRTRVNTQLGLALQLGTVRFLGLFLLDSQWQTVPDNVVQYVAAQLSLSPALWQTYIAGRRPTISDHQALIRQQYSYRDFSEPAVQFSTARWLYTRAWLHDEPPSRLFDLLVLRLKERKVILPGITTLEECINHIRDQVAQRIWKRIARQLTSAQRERLQMLVTGGQKGQTPLDELRHGPVTI